MAVAGSITVTTSKASATAVKYSIAWVSSAGGAVTENAVSLKAGNIVQVVFTPDGGGTAPTDLYDVTLVIANGTTDLLGGAGANLSGTLINFVGADIANLPVWVPAGNYWPTVANGGNAKGGTMDIYVDV